MIRAETLPLFGEPTEAAARAKDPETSHAAARKISTQDLEKIVLAALAKMMPAGATSHELAEATRYALVTISPRMRPLTRKGKVVDSGERRPTPSGSTAIVWKVAR